MINLVCRIIGHNWNIRAYGRKKNWGSLPYDESEWSYKYPRIRTCKRCLVEQTRSEQNGPWQEEEKV